ncbi:hypothetical protein Xph01_10110 [Micromonospora phaseoli]|nr:hypothetical protein Xph01_10110 [Micromonospora phaseoli]
MTLLREQVTPAGRVGVPGVVDPVPHAGAGTARSPRGVLDRAVPARSVSGQETRVRVACMKVTQVPSGAGKSQS